LTQIVSALISTSLRTAPQPELRLLRRTARDAMRWHTDRSRCAEPALATLLFGLETPVIERVLETQYDSQL